ncbi:glutamate-cysteine ligase family protein [Aeoliella mucimassa]|uniref:glutamate--cysteine ligase n=1 Tax=Aeoliella mucimassa TaxID=2527972 RepID=A0A518ANG8_9BACT|nr:glutamate-cysteine ligase family protein [Aeoliella mucimassa]QDU56275.1 Glutamate-cysteine ligase family 2(GCS2) [Aeoliella mucimassa]
MKLSEQISSYIHEGITSQAKSRIGIEIETICLTPIDTRPSFIGEGCSMQEALIQFGKRLDGELIKEADHVIGVESQLGNLSLEPGCQLEWSSPAAASLRELRQSMKRWWAIRDEVLPQVGLRPTPMALDLLRDCQDTWPPKQRYRCMRDDYQAIGERGLIPMQQTAGIHLSFDYHSESDWQHKFRGILSAIPASIALFSNRRPGVRNFRANRTLYWHRFDAVRTQLPAVAFSEEFSIEHYAAWVASIPDLFETLADDEASDTEHAEHHLSQVFTPVRSKRVLEVRANDRVADRMVPMVAAYWTGLLYDEDSLQTLTDLTYMWKRPNAWHEAFFDAAINGMSASASSMRRTLRILDIALEGLYRIDDTDATAIDDLQRLRWKLHGKPVTTISMESVTSNSPSCSMN